MCAQLSLYVKYDVANPSKQERKLFAKKKLCSDDDEDEPDHKSQKKDTKVIFSSCSVNYTKCRTFCRLLLID